MKISTSLRVVHLALFSSLVATAAGFGVHHRSVNINRNNVLLFMGGPKKQSQDGVRRPTNEFSRTVPPDKVLKLYGKQQRRTEEKRQYSVDLEADEAECDALAERFQLPDIGCLEASLLLSPEGSGGGGSGFDNARGILIEGTIDATVTRTCVRTNEKFQQDVEVPVFCVSRPVNGVGTTVQPEKDASVQLSRSSSSNAGGGKKKRKKSRKNEQSAYDVEEDDEIDPMEMLKMQSVLDGLDERNDEYEDVLMEDEAIYATNGVLDVGELVAQLLWLNLDPYPKKPGNSSPMKFSITG